MYRFVLLVFLIKASDLLSQEVRVGAERTDLYFDLLVSQKGVALVCNHTSQIGEVHLLDTLIQKRIPVKIIFAPEHGFRGEEDAGAKVKSGIDTKSGLPIKSLYGKRLKPSPTDLKGISCIVFDIQDVGARFYTYISTLQYIMEAAAENDIELILLDRPNPNGYYIDGPVLEKSVKSFVGIQPVPIVYGMTIGEYALMLKGEKWIQTGNNELKLTVIPCSGYDHQSRYNLPVPPSPNLKTKKAIELYPSLCLFEGTQVSVGRGTDYPFEVYGSPFIDPNKMSFQFVPKSKKGASRPLFFDTVCYGEFLRNKEKQRGLSLGYLITAYRNWKGTKANFFLENGFFDNLSGNRTLRKSIIRGESEAQIRTTWREGIRRFKEIRKKYLLYPDFE